MQHIVPLLFMFCCFPEGWGQQSVPDSLQSNIVLKHRVKEGNVLLRWGAKDNLTWKLGTENGYVLERYTLERDGKPVLNEEAQILAGGPIRPKPLPDWQNMVENNDMGAILAQAIYGESFSTDSDEDDLFMRVVNQSEELEQRFAFSMFAADQDFEVAQYAGLGFVDTETKSNEKYLYFIKLAHVPEKLSNVGNGVLVDPANETVLPKPYDFAVYYYNNSFVLIWEYDGLLDFYTTYDLEKSEDGTNFHKVNDVPITKLAVTKVSGISYTDSIPEYGKKYWYRVSGRTLFNETGPSSDTTSVIAFKELLAIPQFTTKKILSEKEVALQWDFPKDESWKLKGFDVLRAPKAIGPYKEVAKSLDKQVRHFQYDGLETINYFKVRAHGIAGDYQDSSPAMIQPVDSIPPTKPQGLSGTVDTLGVVRLSWKPNSELDLKGYTVLRADRKTQEFTRLTKREIKENNFLDTIAIDNYSGKVYYQIMASDLRYNESIPSNILVLDRPSQVPPTSPVFKEFEVLGDTIKLEWIGSSSKNLVKQVIYRNNPARKDGLWHVVLETNNTSVNHFMDVKTEPNTVYNYIITAVNREGRESKPSPVVSITTPPILLKPKIKGLFARVNRELKTITLSWRSNHPGLLEVQLFKKENEGDYRLYKTLEPSINEYVDTKLTPNSNYGYGIKAIFTDGSTSQWTETEVTY